ncbi:MAG: DoxX family protein [Chloroflexi bacterium]|jgi:thiosulfate dehydrogenase [quinone] large subunit|nr:DoxX family protein [Chloroflexota bacterium]
MVITNPWHARGAALLRVVVGIVMLWAGLEKLIGTPGGWTAAGFLEFATAGSLGWPFVSGEPAEGAVFSPLHDFWVGLAGNATVLQAIDALVIWGELLIGVALVLGLLTRFASILGALMMILFFLAAWDFAYGIVNQQLTYAVVFLAIGGMGAGKYYGLDAWAGRTAFATRNRWFRTWFLSGDPADDERGRSIEVPSGVAEAPATA